MNPRFRFLLVLLAGLLNVHGFGASPAPEALPRSRPEDQGISAAAILEFVEAVEQRVDAVHSFMLVRHGQVVAEGWWAPYGREQRHELYSLSKSFTSTAVGLAVAEGRLTIDDTVLSFFPEDAPADPSDQLKGMRVRDLLCMSAGHEREVSSAPEQISARSFLTNPVPFKPGTRFLYNTPATFMLSAIVQKKTGQTVLDYLRPRLFEPLGIADPVWETNYQGISLGGYGLSVRTEDIAKFGQLYLQQGQWQGKTVLPAAWVEAATARQTSNGSNPASDWDQGYGFQFWRSRHGAYRGDGAFGQYCLVMPDQDAVLAVTSGLRDMQAVLNLVWERLLPAMRADAVPRDDGAEARLQERLARLALRTPQGGAQSTASERVAGRTFRFPANDQGVEALRLQPDPAGRGEILTVKMKGIEQSVRCGYGRWVEGRLTLPGQPERVMAASGAWSTDDLYTARICFHETPYCLTLQLRFEGDRVYHNSELNVSFGPTKQAELVGLSQ